MPAGIHCLRRVGAPPDAARRRSMDRNTETKIHPVRVALTGVLVAMAVAAAACNTMEGAGEDVEDAGEAIEDAAN